MTVEVKETVEVRQKEYGGFDRNSEYAQAFKCYFRDHMDWESLSYQQAEALDMIASKLSRIMCNPNHKDSWHDIAGYATLVEETL